MNWERRVFLVVSWTLAVGGSLALAAATFATHIGFLHWPWDWY